MKSYEMKLEHHGTMLHKALQAKETIDYIINNNNHDTTDECIIRENIEYIKAAKESMLRSERLFNELTYLYANCSVAVFNNKFLTI